MNIDSFEEKIFNNVSDRSINFDVKMSEKHKMDQRLSPSDRIAIVGNAIFGLICDHIEMIQSSIVYSCYICTDETECTEKKAIKLLALEKGHIGFSAHKTFFDRIFLAAYPNTYKNKLSIIPNDLSLNRDQRVTKAVPKMFTNEVTSKAKQFGKKFKKSFSKKSTKPFTENRKFKTIFNEWLKNHLDASKNLARSTFRSTIALNPFTSKRQEALKEAHKSLNNFRDNNKKGQELFFEGMKKVINMFPNDTEN